MSNDKTSPKLVATTVFPILVAISFSHLLNDTIQSLIAASYPIFKETLHLSFTQIGFVTFAFQFTASMLQPAIGTLTDRRPQPFSLALGMASTLAGLVLLSFAVSYPLLLLSVVFIGLGSAVFHPESSRVAHLAAGQRRGLAQSVFQVGGNLGQSLGPLLAALVITGRGIRYNLWFVPIALVGVIVLTLVGRWYRAHIGHDVKKTVRTESFERPISKRRAAISLGLLLLLMFSKYFYLASFSNFYTFFLIERFHVSVFTAQIHLFVFLFAVAAGTLLGGPIGDRLGRKYVIWASILGIAPFTLVLPYVGLAATTTLSFVIGFVLASAFPAIVVYAQELVPGRVGTISGLFFGFAFGLGAIGSAVLGMLADSAGVEFVYRACAYLPLLGLFAAFLPKEKKRHA